MLRTRVIPVVLLNGHSVVKSTRFDVRRNLGSPITVARVYNTRNVDELILLDIDASKQGRSIDLFTVQAVAAECFMPLTIGGGIRSVDDIRAALKRGADKVAVNSEALKNLEFIRSASQIFGAQCIVGSVDLKLEDGHWIVYSHSHSKVREKDPITWCKELESFGVGEIFINFVDLDGVMGGPCPEFIEKIVNAVRVPVIACGGISTPDDAVKVANAGASGVAAASIFHFTNHTPLDCKMAMEAAGITVRL